MRRGRGHGKACAWCAQAWRGCTIDSVSAPAGPPPRIEIPRWVQLVGLPVGIFFGWIFAEAAGHTLFLLLIALLIALLLDPLVLALGALRIRRGIAVAAVYITFAALIAFALIALGTVVVSQTKTAAQPVNSHAPSPPARTTSPRPTATSTGFQLWLDDHHLASIKIEKKGHTLVQKIRERDVGKYTTPDRQLRRGGGDFDRKGALRRRSDPRDLDLHAARHAAASTRAVNRRPAGGGRPLISRMEHALVSYVRGQILLSLIIGASAGLGLWILGVTGLLPGADNYALLFGGWVAFTGVPFYLGPWLGSILPAIYALVVHPFSVIW